MSLTEHFLKFDVFVIGKILEDDKLMIKEYGIDPAKNFVVVMITKVYLMPHLLIQFLKFCSLFLVLLLRYLCCGEAYLLVYFFLFSLFLSFCSDFIGPARENPSPEQICCSTCMYLIACSTERGCCFDTFC